MSDRLNPSHPIVALMAARYELVRELDAHGDVRRWEAFDTALQRAVLLEFLPHDLAASPDVVERFWRSARSSARTSTTVGERVLDAGTDPETGRAFVVREWPSAPARATERTTALPVRPVAPNHSRAGAGRSRRVLLGIGVSVAATAALLIVRPGVDGWLAWVNEPLSQATQRFVLGPAPKAVDPGAQPARTAVPTAAATAAAKATAAAPTPVPTPNAARTPTPAAGAARRIVNTEGRGVALRSSPGGDRLPGKGYDEGATVQAFETSGEWTRIQGSDGRQGWVLSVTLSR